MVTKRPRAFFYRRFGQKHFIAHGHIEQIVNGPQLKCMDVVGLSHLSVQMQNCWLILTQMGYEADTNNSDNLVKIVKRLPLHLQSKWANEAGNLTLTGIESTFSHLAKFLEGKAMLANTMYGEIVGSAPDKERNTKQPSKEKTAGQDKRKIYSIQSRAGDGPVRNATPPVPNCPLCFGQHRLARCELMKVKSPEERKGFVRKTSLCDNCFRSGHMAIDRRSKVKCQVNGCG